MSGGIHVGWANYVGRTPPVMTGHELFVYVLVAAAVLVVLFGVSAVDRWWRE